MRRIALFALAAALCAGSAVADDKPAAQDALKLYYTVAIAADRCGWPITTAEIGALDKAAAAAQETLKLDEEGADAFFNTLDAEFAREKNQRCVSGSDIERLYKKILAELAK